MSIKNKIKCKKKEHASPLAAPADSYGMRSAQTRSKSKSRLTTTFFRIASLDRVAGLHSQTLLLLKILTSLCVKYIIIYC